MIRFYLTGGVNFGEFQNNPNASLGGYISTCPVRNGEKDTLLSGVSEFSRANMKSEYSCIALVNEGNENVTSMKVSVANPESAVSKLVIAVVYPSLDEDKRQYFETIRDRYAQPFYADFDEANSGFDVAVLKPNEAIGVWLRRDIINNGVPTSDQLDEAFVAKTELPTEDDLVIEVEYSE